MKEDYKELTRLIPVAENDLGIIGSMERDIYGSLIVFDV